MVENAAGGGVEFLRLDQRQDLIGDDGSGLERLTTEGHFNSFPMFSPDGTRLVWVSDRLSKAPGEFNVFMADWVP